MIHRNVQKAWQKSLKLLTVLDAMSSLAILVAVITYLTYGEQKQHNAEVTQSWTVITGAFGQKGSGGRIQSLEFLNSSPNIPGRRRFPWVWLTWKPESLEGLEAPEAFLQEIQLPNANLWQANLNKANMRGANLRNSRLDGANLQRVTLAGANLQNSSLRIADLRQADLYKADLIGANLVGANLQRAGLADASLQLADLSGAKLSQASLNRAKLQKAKYTDKNTSLELCDSLFLDYPCATNFPEGFDPVSKGMIKKDLGSALEPPLHDGTRRCATERWCR